MAKVKGLMCPKRKVECHYLDCGPGYCGIIKGPKKPFKRPHGREPQPYTGKKRSKK